MRGTCKNLIGCEMTCTLVVAIKRRSSLTNYWIGCKIFNPSKRGSTVHKLKWRNLERENKIEWRRKRRRRKIGIEIKESNYWWLFIIYFRFAIFGCWLVMSFGRSPKCTVPQIVYFVFNAVFSFVFHFTSTWRFIFIDLFIISFICRWPYFSFNFFLLFILSFLCVSKSVSMVFSMVYKATSRLNERHLREV